MITRRGKKPVVVPAFFVGLLTLLCLVQVRAQAQEPVLPATESVVSQGSFDVQIIAPAEIQDLLQRHLELMRYRSPRIFGDA